MNKVIVATLLALLSACGGEPESDSALAARMCSPRGSDAAFDHVVRHLKSESNFYNLAVHKPAIKRQLNGCTHEVMGTAERGSMRGLIKSYAAVLSYDVPRKIWVIDEISADE